MWFILAVTQKTACIVSYVAVNNYIYCILADIMKLFNHEKLLNEDESFMGKNWKEKEYELLSKYFMKDLFSGTL